MKKILEIHTDMSGVFLRRVNRFLGIVRLDVAPEDPVEVHIHDPGRLKELLFPGNRVGVRRAGNPNRKTSWDLISAAFQEQWILVHSGFHSRIAERLILNPEIRLLGDIRGLDREVTFGHSRMDFVSTLADDRRIVIEVKGCSLAVGGTALFPDAPTTRGTRHVQTLRSIVESGGHAALIILVFRSDSLRFMPHYTRDPAFAHAVTHAVASGVQIHPVQLHYHDNWIWFEKTIPYAVPPQGNARKLPS